MRKTNQMQLLLHKICVLRNSIFLWKLFPVSLSSLQALQVILWWQNFHWMSSTIIFDAFHETNTLKNCCSNVWQSVKTLKIFIFEIYNLFQELGSLFFSKKLFKFFVKNTETKVWLLLLQQELVSLIVNQLWIYCFVEIDKFIYRWSAAACNIGGCTIHAFAGIGLGNESKQELLNNVCKKSSNIKRWKKTSVLNLPSTKQKSHSVQFWEWFDNLFVEHKRR